MSDHSCQFSCTVNVRSAKNAARAEVIRGELAADIYREEGGYPGFDVQVDHELGEGALWIYSDEYGNPEHVIRFVCRCAEAFHLKGMWGFAWSCSASKPLIDAFGGGAHVLDLGTGRTLGKVDCNEFVTETILAGQSQDPATEEAS